MVQRTNTKNNWVVLSILVLEIIFILGFIPKSELLKETIQNKPDQENMGKCIAYMTIVLGIIVGILFGISWLIQKYCKINRYLTMTFLFTNLILYVEHKMSTNVGFSTTEDDLQNALDRAQTGDFVFFRSYESDNMLYYMAFRVMNALISSTPFFSHIGMIVKIDNVAYILESTSMSKYCIHANTVKSGVILTNAYERIQNDPGRIFLSRNNLHNYIRDEDITAFMNQYGDLDYLENNTHCVTLMCMFLYYANVFKHETHLISMSKMNNPDLYKVDFKNIENVKLKNQYYQLDQ